jgi:SAM-dependent methyltransferase
MLDVLRAHAYRPFGFDVSVGALRFPKGEKLRVAAGEAEHIPVQDGCFDAAISLHVIEHLLDPRGFVNTLSRTVRPGGVIAIVTEDAHIAQYSWERFRRRLAGAVPRFRSSYDHTFVFRAEHLEKLLREAGCSEVRTTALTRRIEGESLHWRAYKGVFRWLDRFMGHGEILIAVGRLSP